MVEIRSVAADIRRGIKKKKKKKIDRKKIQGKNIMPPLLHRAAITSKQTSNRKETQKQYLSNSKQVNDVVTSEEAQDSVVVNADQ